MSRPRPKLDNWDRSLLAALGSSDPREWVETVLTNAKEVRRARSWSFGEIREAIRLEIERRGGSLNPANAAHVRTQRGLAALREDGLVIKQGAKYRFPKRFRYSEMIASIVRDFARQRAPLRVKWDPVHLADGNHAAILNVEFGEPGGPLVTMVLSGKAEPVSERTRPAHG